MGKVVTGKGMDDFVQNGTFETIKSAKKPKKEAPPLEVVPDKPVVDPKPTETPQTPPPAPLEEETGLEPEDSDLAERAQKRISRKHREMKQAEALAKRLQEELGDSETFSKSQYSRAVAAEEEAARLRAEVSELRSKAAPAAPTGLVKPDAKDPKYYDEKGQFKAFEYAEDLSGYSATKAVEEDRKRQNEERTKAQQAEAIKAFEARLEKAREKYPDFKEVVGATDMIVPPYVQQFMVRSPFGGDLGYWFAKNQDEAKRIFALDPIDAVAELGEITVQWKKPSEAKSNVVPILPKTGAPAPIVPLQSQASAQTNTDPAKMDYKSLRAYERERARNKGR
jgi:hypothetical protein